MKHDNTPPDWRDAKAWAEEQESGDAVAGLLLAFFSLAGLAGLILLY